jgi:hypothetical protein
VRSCSWGCQCRRFDPLQREDALEAHGVDVKQSGRAAQCPRDSRRHAEPQPCADDAMNDSLAARGVCRGPS